MCFFLYAIWKFLIYDKYPRLNLQDNLCILGRNFPTFGGGESRGLAHANGSKQIRGAVGTRNIISFKKEGYIGAVSFYHICVCAMKPTFKTCIAQSTQEATPLYFFGWGGGRVSVFLVCVNPHCNCTYVRSAFWATAMRINVESPGIRTQDIACNR
jgi:hypothetical protein